MSRPPFPSVIDSSLLSDFRSCPGHAFLKSFLHWKPKVPSVHLHAGKAFARGLEVARVAYYQGGVSPDSAVALGMKALVESYGDFECPSDSAKSLERMMGAFEFYFSSYPLFSDSAKPAHLPGGKLGVEFSFCEPLEILHPETGDPILYSGRFDMICDYAGGLYGEDDKTTSSLGPTWARSWDLRSQFTAYCWGAQRLGINLEGFLVRGVSILKTKYETQQAITYRPRWMIDHWYEQVHELVARMIQYWDTTRWAWAMDDSCNSYGGCEFRQYCLMQPDKKVNVLQTNFTRRRWDPVLREESAIDPAA